ncbi:MAG: rhamnose transport system substrate-binding protein [Rhodospirillaceae bacterium]|jgi:rhamnose transport system substrate-binding protein|nr:rhamnose transport system substrate-binding protein [Rhodospirillaceae bacterium]
MRFSRRTTLLLAAAFAFGISTAGSAEAAGKIRIAMLVKSLGNGFFDAAHQGGEEAAKQIGGVELIYTGPTAPTAEGQIELINSLIAQKVDAIAISANDPNALVPIAKKAMSRGIKVLSFDSAIAAGGRMLHLNPSNNQLIGEKLVQMTADAAGGSGSFAILSATAQATNQNTWIAEVKKVLAKPDYANLKLVATVYGDDQPDKSYREALGLLKSYPDLKVITAPTTVGIAAAAKAVEDQNLIGKVYVTGLGLPSEMKGHVESGATKTFAIWNPIDLGYTTTYLAYRLVKGEATGKPGEEIDAGRMGKIKIGDNSEAAMSPPFTFDKSNIDQFAKMF